ncbi:hypothetical protein [Chamaesiphon sp.]
MVNILSRNLYYDAFEEVGVNVDSIEVASTLAGENHTTHFPPKK